MQEKWHTTDTAAFAERSAIPATAKAFHAWWYLHRHEWPSDLDARAKFACLSLVEWESNPKSQDIEHVRTGIAKHLLAFAQAYGAWKSRA